MKDLSNCLSKLTQLSQLNLDLRECKIGSIKSTQISLFNKYLKKHQLEDTEMKDLSNFLSNLTHLSQLHLNY